MASDFSKPLVTDAYATLLPTLVTELQDLARGLEPTATGTHTNIPTNAIRWNQASSKWERYNGTSWGSLPTTADTYAISITGNAATASQSTSLLAGSLGSIPYQSAAGITAMLAAGTAGMVLASGGAAAPVWTLQSALSVGSAVTAGTANALNAANSYTVAGLTVTGTSSKGGAAASVVVSYYASSVVRGYTYADANGVGFLNNGGGAAAYVPYGTSNWTVTGNISSGNQYQFSSGSGNGYVAASDSNWGMIFRPGADGATADHLWTNAAGAGLMQLSSAGNLTTTTFTGSGSGLSGTANSLNAGLGVNQTWQNMTGSRALGTTYTNSTGKPIQVVISGTGLSVGCIYTFSVAGTVIGTTGGTGTVNEYATASFIVPAGATYAATNSSGTTLSTWYELR